MKKFSVPTGVELSNRIFIKYPSASPGGEGGTAWTPFISEYASVYFCQVNPNIHKAAGGGGGRGYLPIKSSHLR